MLTNHLGAPEAPTDVVRGLKAIDERLDLMHIRPSQHEMEENPNARGRWAFILHWLAGDPRRERIKIGELGWDAAFDYIGEIPFDCDVNEARAYFEKCMKRSSHLSEAGTLLDRVREWNTKQMQTNQEEVEELGLEILDRYKGNADFAASLGVGTVVTSAGGLAKPEPTAAQTVQSVVNSAVEKVMSFPERMRLAREAKKRQTATAGATT
jgi:hypothetical protein